jgi:hypothetical protein
MTLLANEGSGPGLGSLRACHCAECTHVRAGRWLELGMAGATLAVAGLIVVPLNVVIGLLLAGAGGIAAASAYSQLLRRSLRVRADLPVALHPKVSDAKLSERLRIRIRLGPEGDYRTDFDQVRGNLTIVATFGPPDRERARRRTPKRPPADRQDLRYTAGRLVLDGPLGIKASEDLPGPTIRLDGTTGQHPAFRAENPPASSQWPIDLDYELLTVPDITSGPFWITPSIVPESDKHELELDIQWVEFGPDPDRPLDLDVIESLQLRFPLSWGGARQVSPPATEGLIAGESMKSQGCHVLEWKQLSPSQAQRERRRLTIAVQFEDRISPEDELSGELEATMKGALSGIERLRLYSALGTHRRFSGSARVSTRIEAAFTLSLQSIRYQAVRVVPDLITDDNDLEAVAEEFHVVPDNETVVALTNAIGNAGYYVKRVIENPPRSGGRANQVQRYWDIAGRYYQSIYPIDFHIILIGEEVHTGDIRPEAGTTKVRIVVSGAYTDNEPDRYARIQEQWNQLHHVTTEALKRQASPGRAPE